MKTIYPTGILVYYDGVQVFEACDAIGGHYIAMLVDTVDYNNRYLVTGARPERLKQFRDGTLDLRTLLLEAPGGKWYTTLTNSDPGDELLLQPQDGPLSEIECLPRDGYILGIIKPVCEPEIQQALAAGQAATLVGEVDQVDRSAGAWTLLTTAGAKSGKTAHDSPVLNSLKIGSRYRFHCAIITESDEFWRNHPTLYLTHHESL